MAHKRTLFTPVSPQIGLTQAIAARLTEEILSGKFASRDRLPSVKEMAIQFGVSQTVIREAMARLSADGLVVVRHGSGVYVVDDLRRRPLRIDPQSVSTVQKVVSIMEVRLGLEIESAGLAAARRSQRQLRAIGTAFEAIGRAAAHGHLAIEEDRAFHAAIAEATGNPHYPTFLEFLGRYIIPRQRVRVGRGTMDEQTRYLDKIQSEHAAIYETIRARDVTKARVAMRRHLTNGLKRLKGLDDTAATAEPPY